MSAFSDDLLRQPTHPATILWVQPPHARRIAWRPPASDVRPPRRARRAWAGLGIASGLAALFLSASPGEAMTLLYGELTSETYAFIAPTGPEFTDVDTREIDGNLLGPESGIKTETLTRAGRGRAFAEDAN
jgi:hypothetical protein